SLLAKAVVQSTSMLNDKPHSRAGSLPQGVAGGVRSPAVTRSVGAKPARESGGSVNINVE
ncbi:hypothetical protein QF019_006345, partial [Pseudomonas frederiksbergensis]